MANESGVEVLEAPPVTFITSDPPSSPESKTVIHDELEPSEAMPGFADSLRNIVHGYESVFAGIQDDGNFADPIQKDQAATKWSKWHDNKILPDFVDEKDAETMAEIEGLLEKVKKGETSLNYGDKGSLIEYFKHKYPNQKDSISKIFADFSHDVDFVSNGINFSFGKSEDESDQSVRDAFIRFRKKDVRQWPIDVMESTAQLLEKNVTNENFSPIDSCTEIKKMFDEVSRAGGVQFEMFIDADPRIEDLQLKGNKLWFKRAIYNHARNVHKYAEARRDRVFYDTFIFQEQDNKLIFSTEDNRDGFQDEELIDPNKSETVFAKNGKAVKRRLVFGHGKKGSESTGSGFGMNIFWQVMVNMHGGSNIDVLNWRSPNEKKPGPTGSRLFSFLPISSLKTKNKAA